MRVCVFVRERERETKRERKRGERECGVCVGGGVRACVCV